MRELDYATLDPAIREAVRALNSVGFCTTDSGDGGKVDTMGCAVPFANITLVTNDGELLTETDRVARMIRLRGLNLVPFGQGEDEDAKAVSIQASYDPSDGSCVILLTGPGLLNWGAT